MKPRRISLVRHGESEGNVDRIIHATIPDWKIALTEKGRVQAARAGATLIEQGVMNPAVYLSPYRRTRETWEGIRTATGAAFVKEDPRLREQEWGNLRAYDGRSWADVETERDAFGPFYYRFLHGESGADVWDRCTTFLDTLYRDFAKADFPSEVLIVTHGFTMRVLLMRWLHWTVDEFHALKNPPNGWMCHLVLGDDDRYSLSQPFPTK